MQKVKKRKRTAPNSRDPTEKALLPRVLVSRLLRSVEEHAVVSSALSAFWFFTPAGL